MRSVGFVLSVLLILSFSVFGQTYPVYLNSIGLLPKHEKTAVIPQQSETFKVINAETGEEVFSDNAQAPKYQQDVEKKYGFLNFRAFN